MPVPVPDHCTEARFEFRVWDPDPDAVRRIEDAVSLDDQDPVTDEYVVSAFGGVNVKIRDGEVQVKRLLATIEGCQQWCPTWEYAGALDPEGLGRFHGELGIDPIVVVADTAELVSLARAHPDLAVVGVTKHRRQGDLGAVTVEVTELERDDGAHTTTCALEGPDADELVRVRTRLGLEGEENVAMSVGVARAWTT